MAESYIGEIIIFAGNFAPRNYALCNGQLLPIAQNAALFSILGVMYGGDGKSTFALPNLQGRVAIHPNQSYPLATSIGAETVTLQTANLPPHTHAMMCNSGAGTTSSPVNAVLAAPPATRTSTPPLAFGSGATSMMGAGAIGTAGASTPVTTLQPLLALNYCICTSGIFPSRP